MNHSRILALLDLVREALQNPEVVAQLKWPTPTLEITLPASESKITVELGVANRREAFTVLFKSQEGANMMCLGYFGNRAIPSDQAGDSLVTGGGNWEFHCFLNDVDQLIELIWERCVEIYFNQMVDGYETRASAKQKDVAAFFEYLKGS